MNGQKKLTALFVVLLTLSSANAGLVSAIMWGAGTVAVVAVTGPIGLAAVGYTAGGITAGSYAAGMMSAAAIANGGGVAAGGTVAVLQAAGAAGISYVVPAAAGAAVAGAKVVYDGHERR